MNEELGIMNGGTCRPFLKRVCSSIIRHSSFVICHSPRGAFTLVEMMIVVAILAVLMTIVFRLGGLGGEDKARSETVIRMQRIENCLSGYYAAFGSYPPVTVHGWRNIKQPVDRNGDQTESNADGSMNQSESGSGLVWSQVDAACRSQPFGCEYPPSTSTADGDSEEDVIKKWAEEVAERVGNSSEYPLYASGKWGFSDIFSGSTIIGPDSGDFGGEYWNNPDWKAVKIFKFGVMSFLLPRYLFMMGGEGQFFGTSGANGSRSACAQWSGNNDMPCDPLEGSQYANWNKVIEYAQYGTAADSVRGEDLARVVNIPSQAVCARWIPNLEGLCSTVKSMQFFGINISGGTGLSVSSGVDSNDEVMPPDPCTHNAPNGKVYRNASVTISDGWGNEFYYYSPAPYQTYTLWSAGANRRTFPPWMDLDDLSANDKKTAMEWRSDDIMQMSH